jgi:hypothetical protein
MFYLHPKVFVSSSKKIQKRFVSSSKENLHPKKIYEEKDFIFEEEEKKIQTALKIRCEFTNNSISLENWKGNFHHTPCCCHSPASGHRPTSLTALQAATALPLRQHCEQPLVYRFDSPASGHCLTTLTALRAAIALPL